MKTRIIFAVLPIVAVMLIAASCSNDIDGILTQTSGANAKKTTPFTVKVNTRVSTRATLNADQDNYVFEAGDKLYVQNTDGSVYGTLTLDDADAGKSTGASFTGELTGEVSDATELKAVLKSTSDVIVQVGSDNKVTGYDYPVGAIAATPEEAIRKYSAFEGTSTYAAHAFTLSQQSSFISFDVALIDGTSAGTSIDVNISASDDAISREGSSETVIESDVMKAKFVAAFQPGTVLTKAIVIQLSGYPDLTFGLSADLEMESNNIYVISKRLVNLGTLTDDFTAKSGDLLFGTQDSGYNVKIADKAKVTLCGAVIQIPDDVEKAAIQCLGDATLVVEEECNEAISGTSAECRSGVFVPSNKTLTIKGSGKLTAQGGMSDYGEGGAGIGAGSDGCGNIVIDMSETGSITAIGKKYAAGIGGSSLASCGDITILGGSVYGTGGENAPGIGCGDDSNCGVITLSGGNITAKAGSNAKDAVGNGGVVDDEWVVDDEVGGKCTKVEIVSGVKSLTLMIDAESGKVTDFINATVIVIAGQVIDTETGDDVLAVNNAIISTFFAMWQSNTWSFTGH